MTIYYLMVKTHKTTGLKYLCQTTRKDYQKYLGSGEYWNDHLRIHGAEIITDLLEECYSMDQLKERGLYYSNLWNVVEARNKSGKKIWANLIPEEGHGYPTGAANPVHKQIANGTHPFADSEFATERNNRWVENGTHQFLTRSDGTSLQQDRVNAGTHNFIGGKSQRITVARNMEEGTHPSQLQWCCVKCRYHGKGASNYVRHINSKLHK